MPSQTLEILRHGIWASLTGGWFYDPSHRTFTNAFHLYLFLSLLCTPFALHLAFPAGSTIVWGLYALALLVLFGVVKVINARLHHMFDTQEAVKEESERDEEAEEEVDLNGQDGGEEGGRAAAAAALGLAEQRTAAACTQEGGIELKELGHNVGQRDSSLRQERALLVEAVREAVARQGGMFGKYTQLVVFRGKRPN